MIGGHDEQCGVRAVSGGGVECGDGNGRRRIASERLQQKCVIDPGRLRIGISVKRQKQEVAIGDGEDMVHTSKLRRTLVGLADQGAAVRQLDEWLRVRIARKRP